VGGGAGGVDTTMMGSTGAGGGRRFSGRGGRGGDFRMCLAELFFEVLGCDLIQRAGGDARGGNAQFLRLGEHLFVLQAKFL
jgi:hypothetical protein